MALNRQVRLFSRRQFMAGPLATDVTLRLPKSSAGHHGSTHWGTLREGVRESRARDDKILEIFLTGGLSPWETLYLDDPGTKESDETSNPGSWRGSFGFAPRPLWDAPEGETPMWDRTRVALVPHNQAPRFCER